jgi:hypothetical protein
MEYRPIITSKVIIFDLQKPIYGSFYGIWQKWLDIAEKRGLKLVVNTKEGTSTFESAKEYKKGAKRLERYYKNPNEPMIFYARGFLPEVKKRDERKKLERKVEDTQGDVLFKILTKLKEQKPELYQELRNKFV